MKDSIEMTDLSGKPPGKQSPSPETDTVISTWAWVTAILLLIMASCLILFPRLLLFISESTSNLEHRTALTPLESFFAIQFGVWLIAIAVTLVLNVPDGVESLSTTPQSHPLLGSLTIAANVSAFISYNTRNIGPLASIFCVSSGVIGLWGLWAIVFGGSHSISSKTGADKHTSSFLFGNKSAASMQKKQWRKEQRKPVSNS